MSNKWRVTVFVSLYFLFCRIVCNFSNFQLLVKILNFIFIEYASDWVISGGVMYDCFLSLIIPLEKGKDWGFIPRMQTD